eukprot:18849-Chlamydomonas_euryale.AAC.1
MGGGQKGRSREGTEPGGGQWSGTMRWWPRRSSWSCDLRVTVQSVGSSGSFALPRQTAATRTKRVSSAASAVILATARSQPRTADNDKGVGPTSSALLALPARCGLDLNRWSTNSLRRWSLRKTCFWRSTRGSCSRYRVQQSAETPPAKATKMGVEWKALPTAPHPIIYPSNGTQTPSSIQ